MDAPGALTPDPRCRLAVGASGEEVAGSGHAPRSDTLRAVTVRENIVRASVRLLSALVMIVGAAQIPSVASAHRVSGASDGDRRAGAPLDKCGPIRRGTHVVRSNDVAVVYSRHPYATAPQSDLDAYACVRATGRRWYLDGNGVDSLLESFRLRGRYFAWTDQTLSGPASIPGPGVINLVDVVTRARLVSAEVVDGRPDGNDPAPYFGSTSLPSLAIGPRGELAWIGSADAWYPTGAASSRIAHYEVWFSHSGRNNQLAAGQDIAPHSLSLSANGSTVAWRSRGQRHTVHVAGS